MQSLVEKWQPILENEKVEAIKDDYRSKVTAQLLENQERYLKENATSQTTGVDNYDPVLIKLVRRLAPKLIAYDIAGVQPMTMPTGLVFAMKANYTDNTNPGAEALFDEADTTHTGTGAQSSGDEFLEAVTTGTGVAKNVGETNDAWASMSLTIDKMSVEAKTRQLRADYSLELAQDLRAVHGLDAESELTNILSQELITEINRELIRTIFSTAKLGAQWHTNALPVLDGTAEFAGDIKGVINVGTDLGGRWTGEQFKGLMYAIERDANAIAVQTRRGKGNFIIASSDVASALAMAGVLDYTPAINNNLEVDATGATYAGNVGRYRVYIDPYLTKDGYLVGYKGQSPYDSGIFYCPYVPLMLYKSNHVTTFQPALGFKTRYGMAANPFVNAAGTIEAGVNDYFRKVRVANLISAS